MTKGQLSYTWVPIERYLYKSDLWRDLVADFGSAGPVVWLVLQGEWREPEAEVITRTVDGQPTRGLYRRCRFSYLWDLMPKGIGNKRLGRIMTWLHDREHWILDPVSLQSINRITTVSSQSQHRGDTGSKHMMGAWWPKLLKFREGCFGYIDREKREIKRTGSTEPNQTESKPNSKYVLNFETGEYDRVPVAGSKEKGD